MIASSSAMTTRRRRAFASATAESACRELGGDAVEELVLLDLELLDVLPERVAMASERVGVAARVAGFDVGERGFGHQRSQPDVVGLLLEEHELLLRDGELGADPLQTFADVDEAPLQHRARHGPRVYGG